MGSSPQGMVPSRAAVNYGYGWVDLCVPRRNTCIPTRQRTCLTWARTLAGSSGECWSLDRLDLARSWGVLPSAAKTCWPRRASGRQTCGISRTPYTRTDSLQWAKVVSFGCRQFLAPKKKEKTLYVFMYVYVYIYVYVYMTCRIQNPDIPRAGRVGARRGGEAGSGRTGCKQKFSPRREASLVPSKASKSRGLNVSPEARTNEILCKPME